MKIEETSILIKTQLKWNSLILTVEKWATNFVVDILTHHSVREGCQLNPCQDGSHIYKPSSFF